MRNAKKLMGQIDIAWVAGIIEGEGYINFPKGDGYPSVRVSMTDEDILLRLQAATGMGTIQARKTKEEPHHKQQWLWAVCARKDVVRLLLAIYPLMGKRRSVRIADATNRLLREPKKPGPAPIYPCGTRAAANRHYVRDEKPCESCRLAVNKYQNRKKELDEAM